MKAIHWKRIFIKNRASFKNRTFLKRKWSSKESLSNKSGPEPEEQLVAEPILRGRRWTSTAPFGQLPQQHVWNDHEPQLIFDTTGAAVYSACSYVWLTTRPRCLVITRVRFYKGMTLLTGFSWVEVPHLHTLPELFLRTGEIILIGSKPIRVVCNLVSGRRCLLTACYTDHSYIHHTDVSPYHKQ